MDYPVSLSYRDQYLDCKKNNMVKLINVVTIGPSCVSGKLLLCKRHNEQCMSSTCKDDRMKIYGKV